VHVLTKAFIVIAAVLSIGLSALVIAYAVNTDRIAANYRAMEAKVAATEATAAAAISEASQKQTRLAADNQNLTTALAQRNDDMRRLEQELAILRTEKLRAEAARQATENQIKELGETAKTLSAIIEAYRSENSTLRENELAYRQRMLEMEARIADLESQREVLDQRYRAILEQFTELKRQADALASGTSATGTGDQPFVYSGPRINGRIEEVAKDSTGKQFARISVGTNDRVSRNMKFLVVREGQFLCNLVVTQPDMKFSIAVADTLGKEVTLQPGDLVISRAD
jgi:vacuolar-type H+-ATPase subunit I/STV1